MMQTFRGWAEVAIHLREMTGTKFAHVLNEGQRASLRAIADRIVHNGVILADEVGMGKTRIAVFVAKAVVQSGGRCVVIIPPGLSFQWAKEFRDCDQNASPVIRSLYGYLEAWNSDRRADESWFKQPIVMVSHRLSNWRLGETAPPWRWCLLPEIYAAARQERHGRRPRGYFDAYDRRELEQRVARAAASIVEAHSNGLGRDILDNLLKDLEWPEIRNAAAYESGQAPRNRLQKAVGLGLGAFDLIIIDEAHKNRSDEGGLSNVIENLILKGPQCRRLALTATPIELDVRQWVSILERIGETTACDCVRSAADQYIDAIKRLRLAWRTDSSARDQYKIKAAQFEKALSPYLLRRDKREDEDVRAFAKASEQSELDYRHLREVAIDFKDLSPEWREAVCAAEALSVVQERAVNGKSRLLRLTIGNGHGLSSIIDNAFRDDEEDRKQIEAEASEAEGPDHDRETDAPKGARSLWWEARLRSALANDPDILFEHPAIRKAVETIEAEVNRGEKALVFGRFTRPMRALVNLLNARQMLRAIGDSQPWPQTKVHTDGCGDEFGEWPAVRAAHRQLESKVDLSRLDELLARQHREASAKRAGWYKRLLPRLRKGLHGLGNDGRSLAILDAIEAQSAIVSGDLEDDELSVPLLARAIAANMDREDAPDEQLARAFQGLIDAASDRDSGEDPELDEEEAQQAWEALKEHLREGYTSRQGSFARLMHGETKLPTRRMIQLAFNRSNSFPHVLVAQSLVGREGLNLHDSCRVVVLLHPEWNPGVVEQQIGRVDRVGSRWAKMLRTAIEEGKKGNDLPRIEICPIIFRGTYDEHNWNVLQERWDDLRAQLHGEALPERLRAGEDAEGRAILDEIAKARPNFLPSVPPLK